MLKTLELSIIVAYINALAYACENYQTNWIGIQLMTNS